MIHELYHNISHLLAESPHAYLALYILLTLGIAGIPLPDEIMLSFVGYNAYKGNLHLIPSILAAFLGSASGLTISYILGRVLGYPVIVRYGRYFLITPEKLDRAHNWFQRRGKWTLIFSIFIPSIRHILAIAAGTSKMSLKSFGFFAYLGALLWTSTFILFGFFLGKQYPKLEKSWRHLSYQMHLIILIVVGSAIALFLLYLILRKIAQMRKPRG